jgi:hypothetical protein
VEWVGGLLLMGALAWAVGLRMHRWDLEVDTCHRCGGPLVLATEAITLVEEGLSTTVPTACAACGARGVLPLPGYDGPWAG